MARLRLKKPKAIVFDVSGTVTKTSFIDKVLIPYLLKNYNKYLEDNWNSRQVKLDLEILQQESEKDPDAPKISLKTKEEAIETSFEYVKYCVDHQKDNKAMTLLRFHMWFDAYAKGKIETPVYSDVAIQLKKWNTELGIKLYIFSNGWAEATKRFLSKTNHGDLNLLIEEHFDTSLGQLTDPSTYKNLLEKINEKPENVILLTKSAEEGMAAQLSGMTVVLVLTHRRDIERLNDDGKNMPRVRSFHELEFE